MVLRTTHKAGRGDSGVASWMVKSLERLAVGHALALGNASRGKFLSRSDGITSVFLRVSPDDGKGKKLVVLEQDLEP